MFYFSIKKIYLKIESIGFKYSLIQYLVLNYMHHNNRLLP